MKRAAHQPAETADAQQRQREELEVILDSMPAMVWYKDRENRIVRANRAAAAAIGKTPEELAGASTYDLYPLAEDYYRDDMEVIRSGQPKLGIIETTPGPDGTQRWVRTDKIPYRDADGTIIGVIVFAVDVTAHKQAEAALEQTRDQLEDRVRERTAELATLVGNLRAEIEERRQVEERLALALWATDLGLWDWNVGTNEVVYNARWAELLGYPPDEFDPVRHSWRSHVHPDDLPSVLKALDDHVHGRLTPHLEIEYRLRTREGDYRWVIAHGRVAAVDTAGHATRVTGTLRDITARKRAEEQVRRQQAELAHVLRVHTLEGMAAEIAHEINQPLGAIANFANGLAARLRRAPGNGTADMLDAAEQIGAQALRAAQVLQRVRDFTRKAPSALVACDINALIRDATHLVDVDARRHEIQLQLHLSDGLPAVMVDAVQVQQVILNLLRNGIEAMAEGEARPNQLMVESGRDAAGRVQVTVSDSGPGIPDGPMARIFEPFFSTKRDGLGMGLSISRSIIESHGGTLVALPIERGAAFRFTLPAAS